jgi:hypothetical protein
MLGGQSLACSKLTTGVAVRSSYGKLKAIFENGAM